MAAEVTQSRGRMALQVREYSEDNLEHSQIVFQTVWFLVWGICLNMV